MVPTVDLGLRLVDFWSIETAGESPSMKSTSGLSICPRNWPAHAGSGPPDRPRPPPPAGAGAGAGPALAEVARRLVHRPRDLAGVRRQRLDVPPLALREDGVEGEAALARAG